MRVLVAALLSRLVTIAPCVDPSGAETAENFRVSAKDQIAVNVDALLDEATEIITANAGLAVLLSWLENSIELV